MASSNKIGRDVRRELAQDFKPPRLLLLNLLINGIISLAFFLFSLFFGRANQNVLPFAAAVIMLWTLADVSITNQLILDRKRSADALKRGGDLRYLLLIKNLTVVIFSIPFCLLFGLIMVAIIGKWSELLYGLIMALVLVWGWLGISNFMSVAMPFELKELKVLLRRKKDWPGYGFLYVLPWIILPIYAGLLALPLILIKWASGQAAFVYKTASVLILLFISLVIWRLSLILCRRYSRKDHAKIKRLLISSD